MQSEAKIQLFQHGMVTYWQQYGRHELPWRRTTDAWKILLAEVLLRKTTSTQVISVYEKLLQYSPTEISNMNQDMLASVLKPLGIHQVRASQLQQIAQAVVDSNGLILQSDEALRKLPGIGRYISNAVRCFAFGVPAPAMDTNLIRVMSRVFSWTSHRKRPREDQQLWKRAEILVPKDTPREFNWGVLDFAATVCTPRKPKCERCLISEICTYYTVNRQTSALEMRI